MNVWSECVYLVLRKGVKVMSQQKKEDNKQTSSRGNESTFKRSFDEMTYIKTLSSPFIHTFSTAFRERKKPHRIVWCVCVCCLFPSSLLRYEQSMSSMMGALVYSHWRKFFAYVIAGLWTQTSQCLPFVQNWVLAVLLLICWDVAVRFTAAVNGQRQQGASD